MVAVVVEAVLRIDKKALKHRMLYGFAAAAFVSIIIFKVSFPYIVAGAALAGLIMERYLPQVFCKGTFDEKLKECRIDTETANNRNNTPPSVAHVMKVSMVCLALWAIPLECRRRTALS